MDKKILWVGLGAMFLVALATVIVFFTSQNNRLRGSVIEPAMPAAEISLTDQNGQPFRLADYRGKVVLLFFGYTYCPDVCPATMAELRAAEALVERRGKMRAGALDITFAQHAVQIEYAKGEFGGADAAPGHAFEARRGCGEVLAELCAIGGE